MSVWGSQCHDSSYRIACRNNAQVALSAAKAIVPGGEERFFFFFFLTEPCRKGPARVGEVIVVLSVSPHLHRMVAREAGFACPVSNGRPG